MVEQFISFFFAGSVAAFVDLVVYNVYLRFVGNDGRGMASVISVSVAMVVSFSLYRNWVFVESNGGSWPVVKFLMITLIAIYGIQSGVIYLSSRWKKMKRWSERIGRWWRFAALRISLFGQRGAGFASAERGARITAVVERNAVKVLAMGVALVWNFLWYRWYVFA